RMGRVRQQSTRQVLRADEEGPEAVGRADRRMARAQWGKQFVTRSRITPMLTDLFYRLRALLRGRALDRELEEELRFHLEHEIDKQVATGRSRDEATRLARLAFGD